jgi:predicted ribosome quality control (RQC) complex YloA/Tae2 family protein
MKGIAALDVLFLVRELKELEGAIVEKVFQPSKKVILFQLHKSGSGKKLLRFVLGVGAYLTSEKSSSEGTKAPSSFAMLLRKKLKQSRITNVVQPGLERIVEVHFSNDLKIIVEIFSKGNLILCDSSNKILAVLEKQEWKDRTVKKDGIYTFPPASANPFEMTDKEFTEKFKKSKRENAVKTLAIVFGLGGKYAEEVCVKAKIDKTRKRVDTSKLLKEILKIKNRPLKPYLVMMDKQIIDFAPVELEIYKEAQKEYVNSCSDALDKWFAATSDDVKEATTEKQRLVSLAEKQKAQITALKKKGEEYKQIGDLIYAHFNEIEQIIKDVKKSDWKIKHKLVKEVNKKERKVILEL